MVRSGAEADTAEDGTGRGGRLPGVTLLTGATGFIGSGLARRLAADGWALRALVRPTTDASWLEKLGVEVVRGDLRDLASLDRALQGTTRVFHLAARTSHGNLPESEMVAINVVGTENVASAALRVGVERFVHCSTARVYGIIRNHAVDEDTPFDPDSAYPESKARAEAIVREHEARGLPLVVARITAVFGPGSKSWLPLFQSIADGSFRMIGSGGNYHHPADLDDVVDGLVRCASVPGVEGRAYILTADEPIRLRDLIAMIADELGTTVSKRPLPGWPLSLYKRAQDVGRAVGVKRLPRFDRVEFFVNDRIFSIARARAELGFEPRVGLRESVRRTADSYRSLGLLPARGSARTA